MKIKNIFKNLKSQSSIDDSTLLDEAFEENLKKQDAEIVEEQEWDRLDTKLKNVVEKSSSLNDNAEKNKETKKLVESNVESAFKGIKKAYDEKQSDESLVDPEDKEKIEEEKDPSILEKDEEESKQVERVVESGLSQVSLNKESKENIETESKKEDDSETEKKEASSNEKVYRIGEYTFDNFKDYRDAQDDFKKIGIIEEKLDIQDPETALKVYKGIRDGEITFKSIIGERFKKHVSDIVADKSKHFLADKKVEEEVKGKVKWQGYLGLALACAAGVLFVYFGTTQYHEYKSAKRAEEMRAVAQANAKKDAKEASKNAKNTASKDTSDTEASAANQNPFEKKEKIDPSTLTMLPEYQELYSENNDMVGWLEIPEPNKPESPFLAYPVVQTARDARVGDTGNYYYLKKNFDNQDDSNGAIFMDYRSDFVNPTTNTIIYGHNMKSGLMFGNLSEYYESKDFYENHKTIFFNTLYEHREYEVIAVCLSEVNYQDESNYRYYNFIDASNMAEWNAFVENVKSLSIYPRDFVVDPGTELLTLSTCDSYKENGRLFIVAKRVS